MDARKFISSAVRYAQLDPNKMQLLLDGFFTRCNTGDLAAVKVVAVKVAVDSNNLIALKYLIDKLGCTLEAATLEDGRPMLEIIIKNKFYQILLWLVKEKKDYIVSHIYGEKNYETRSVLGRFLMSASRDNLNEILPILFAYPSDPIFMEMLVNAMLANAPIVDFFTYYLNNPDTKDNLPLLMAFTSIMLNSHRPAYNDMAKTYLARLSINDQISMPYESKSPLNNEAGLLSDADTKIKNYLNAYFILQTRKNNSPLPTSYMQKMHRILSEVNDQSNQLFSENTWTARVRECYQLYCAFRANDGSYEQIVEEKNKASSRPMSIPNSPNGLFNHTFLTPMPLEEDQDLRFTPDFD